LRRVFDTPLLYSGLIRVDICLAREGCGTTNSLPWIPLRHRQFRKAAVPPIVANRPRGKAPPYHDAT